MALTQEQLNNYYNNIVPENFNPFPNQPAPAPAPAPAPGGAPVVDNPPPSAAETARETFFRNQLHTTCHIQRNFFNFSTFPFWDILNIFDDLF